MTELMLRTPGTQWFEVQNLASHPITLEAMKVEVPETGQSFYLGSIVLLGRARAVIASAPILLVPVDQVWPATFSLPAGTARLQLWGGANNLEEVSWVVPSPTSTSLQLSSAAHAKGANQRPWYWCCGTAALPDASGFGTPGGANGSCGLAPAPPVDWCRTSYPATFSAAPNQATWVFAQVYEPDVTTRNLAGDDGYPHLVVEIGYGSGNDPTAWTWAPAELNLAFAGPSNNDELYLPLSIPAPGSYAYGARAALRDPDTGTLSPFVYCDVNGVVSNPAAATWGLATIAP